MSGSRDRLRTGLRVAVLGAGANGSGVGVDLVRAGYDVTFIDQWPDNVAAARRDGIRVQLAGEETTTEVNMLHLCEAATLRRPFDVVVLVVKAYDTRWACELIEPYLATDGFVIGLQNGMTHDQIAAIVGADRTVPAVIEVTAAMYEPGLVERHSGHDRSWFAVGAPQAGSDRHVATAADLLCCAGVVEVVDDIVSAKWMKLVLNAAELVPSAILDLSIVECAQQPGMFDVMLAAGDEAIRAASVLGLTVRPIFGMDSPEAARPETFVRTVLEELLAEYVRPDSRSTVLQDWMKGRRAEVDELNGEVVEALERKGGTAPVNRAIVEFAKQIEAGERDRGLHLLDPLLARIVELRGDES